MNKIFTGKMNPLEQLHGSLSGKEQMHGSLSGKEQMHGSFHGGGIPTTSGRTDSLVEIDNLYMSMSGNSVVVDYHNHDGDFYTYGLSSGYIKKDEACGYVAVDIEDEYELSSAVVRPAYIGKFESIGGSYKWILDFGGYVETEGYITSDAVIHDSAPFNAIQAGKSIYPSTASQTVGGQNYMMEDYVIVESAPLESKTITTNGTYTPSSGYYGFGEIEVSVAGSSVSLYSESVTISSAGTVAYTPSAGYDGFDKFTTTTPSGVAEAILSLPSIPISLDSSTQTVMVSYHNHDGDHEIYGVTSGFITESAVVGGVVVDIDGTYAIPSASVDAGFTGMYSTSNGVRIWTAEATAYAEEAGWVGAGELSASSLTYNVVPSGTIVSPSTSVQTLGGSNYMMEDSVTIAPMSIGHLVANYDDVYETQNGQRKWILTAGAYVDSGGYVAGGSTFFDSFPFNAVPSGVTITPSTSSQTIGGKGYHMESAVTVSPIPSQYIVPSGTMSVSANGTYDIGSYASVNVSVSYIDGNNLEYGLTDGTLPLVGVAKVGQAEI